jgi:hypothetical protein
VIWDWRDTAFRTIARGIRRVSAERNGSPIYVYVERGAVVARHEFKNCDDYVGCFTVTARDDDIVRFLIDAAKAEA